MTRRTSASVTGWKTLIDVVADVRMSGGGLWSYRTPFLRYDDLLAKNCLFFLPLSHSAPSLPMFPLEFCGKVKHEEDPMIVLTQCQRVTDGRTDLL